MAAKTPNPAVGVVFERLTVTGEPFRRGHNLVLPVRCQCGQEHTVLKSNLVKGKSRSCGCLNIEVVIKRSRKHPSGSRSTYLVWHAMLDRCNREGNEHYHNYGGRGIKVCPEWSTFEGFLADMGLAPAGMTLERQRNDEGYSKNNCIWVPMAVNQLNKRTYRRVQYLGREYTVLKLSRIVGLPWRILYVRIFEQNMPVDQAIKEAA